LDVRTCSKTKKTPFVKIVSLKRRVSTLRGDKRCRFMKRITTIYGFSVKDVKALFIKIFFVRIKIALSSTGE